MPDAIITSTASTFGTITGTFAADQSTITGTVTGIITGTLDGSVGVPGVGVPDGGTTGQVLQKATNTSYDTVWATPSGGAWGTITGTLSNQTDLQTALNLKAPLASPGLTGVPTAPTAATLTSTTQLATTAFVQQELLSGTANAKNLEVYVRNQTGATLTAGTIVYINGATGNRPTITKAQANNDANSAQTFGFVKTSIANNGFGFVIVRGELDNIDTSALTEGVQLYLSPTTAGTWTTTKPSAPQHLVYVGICVRAHPTQGVILVAVQNGYELNELHDVQITSPTNGQVLKYNSSTSLWYNGLDVGIPVGGTAGQFLTKIDGTDYNTDWTTVNLSVYAVKSNNLSDLTSASTARTNLGLGTMATATAADYSTTTVANGLYYPLSTNPAGYLTSASLTGYATESWVTAGFYPLTGNPSGFITSSALTPYLTSATAASTYQTLSGMSSYLTTSAAASTYLTQSNAASTYQTLSGMSSYLTTSTAASTYAPIASPTFTGLATFDNIGNYAISVPASGGAGYDVRIEGQVISLRNAGTELIRIGTGGIKYPDGVTQTVAFPGFAGYAPLASPALTGNVTIATNSASPALVITQDGTGDIVQFKDVTSDTTYSFIDASGKVGTIASTTANAGFNIAHGAAPTTPVNGDIWTTTSGVFARINGATRQYVDFDGTQTINGSKTFSNANNTFGNSTAAGTTNIASGATISGSTKAVNLGTSGVAGSTTNITIGSTTGTSTTTLQGITNGVTQSAGDSSLKLATTAFVTTADNLKANLASPTFTGVPAAPTASPGTNTTQVATTAFVLANAGTPSFADITNVINDPTSTTLALNPSNIPFLLANSNYRNYCSLTNNSISGSAAVTQFGPARELYTSSTTASGRATWMSALYAGDFCNISSPANSRIINWSKRVFVFGTAILGRSSYLGNANTVCRVNLGGRTGNASGNLTTKGIGLFKVGGTSTFVNLTVHNGTTLTNVASSVTVASDASVHYIIYSDGAGNVQLYLNGTLAASTTAGPTGDSTAGANMYEEQLESATSSGALSSMHVAGAGVYIQR